MEKNKYVRPKIEVAYIRPLRMLSTSDVTSRNGIGYGGKDNSGTLTPASPRQNQNWQWGDGFGKEETEY